MSHIDQQAEFMHACNQEVNRSIPRYDDNVLLWKRLIDEEYEELDDDLWRLKQLVEIGDEIDFTNPEIYKAFEGVIKETLDLHYVVMGLLNVIGINPNNGADLLHYNNMTKVGSDGKVQKTTYGKVIKPENYVKLDVGVLHD